MLISEGFQVPSYRPDREIPTNELADPVATDGHCATERKRDVLGLSEEATQRAPLDMPQVFRSLRPDIGNALDVSDCKHVIHEMGGLKKGSQRDVIECPHQQRPDRPADQRSEDEALGLHQY